MKTVIIVPSVDKVSAKLHQQSSNFTMFIVPVSISFGFTAFAEPWAVEDLLDGDDITDKVPLQRLQLLGSNTTLPVDCC